MKPNVVLVSHFSFWQQGYARFSPRIIAMARYLQEHFNLTVIVKGPAHPDDPHMLTRLGLTFEPIYLDPVGDMNNQACFERLAGWMQTNPVDVCIVQYLELAPLLHFIPPHVKTLLDTHDLASEREASFKAFGLQAAWDISWEEELEMFRQFDGLIMIKRADLEKTAKYISRDRLIYASHPVEFEQRQLTEEVTNLGFLATEYPPNIDAICWFLNQVWPSLKAFYPNLQLNIGGNIGYILQECTERETNVLHFDAAVEKINHPNSGVNIKGFVPEIAGFYHEMDMIINPVRIGAGIKVKNIEALGNGLPLITTSHGARGMEDAAPKGMLIANSPSEWINGISALIQRIQNRREMGQSAYEYVQDKFSPESCFGPLRERIESYSKASKYWTPSYR